MSAKKKSSKRTKRSSSPSGRKRKSSERPPRRRRSVPVLLGLGGNRGDPRGRLELALAAIAGIAPIRSASSLYRSEPLGYADQPDFWNAVVEIRWSGSPAGLLAALQRLERRLGRTPTFPGGPREIDIDILDFGGAVRDSPDPVLPHPRLAFRRFALAPLAEIAPSWRHPITGETARGMMRKLPTRPGARRVN